MFRVALVLFLLAGLGGATMAVLYLRGRRPPWLLTIGHGLLATGAVVTLSMAVSRVPRIEKAHGILALYLLVVGGGALTVSYHIRNRRPPTGLIVVHGGAALITTLLLLLYVVNVVP